MNVAALSRQQADEMRQLVFDASGEPRVGERIKAQMNRAWENLGRPKFWRVRAAWNGEAGCWSGVAIREFQARHNVWREQQETKARANAAALATLIEAINADNPNMDSGTAALLQRALRDMGATDSPVA